MFQVRRVCSSFLSQQQVRGRGVFGAVSLSPSLASPRHVCMMQQQQQQAFSSDANKRRISERSLNKHVKEAEYAVRGLIPQRAQEIRSEIEKNPNAYPFKETISCNIGNPQDLGQQPLSFIREVLSLVTNPSLEKRCTFNDDVVQRARAYLASCKSVGSYSDSQGIKIVRDEIADFLEKRDGYRGKQENIFVTNGASDGVRIFMQTILRNSKSSILTPIPQYPLYSALTTLLNGHLEPYYLDESKNWSCSVQSLRIALNNTVQKKMTPRALVVINPGNPTGQLLTEANIVEILEFCKNENICVMADEVYQDNIWKKDSKFVSFRKVAFDRKLFEGENPLQMISFHSISKGFYGECGIRGGYFELLGIPEEVRRQIYKLTSIALCSNVLGQVAMGLVVNPPKPGDASYATYSAERQATLESLKRRSVKLVTALNKLEGVSCNSIDGAMYAFPTIHLSKKAIEKAAKHRVASFPGKILTPDEYYCLELLENTGIVVVPGDGFKQVDGTFHFRTTILPSEEKIDVVCKSISDFHAEFMEKHRD